MGVEDVQIVDAAPLVSIRRSEDHSLHTALPANPATAPFPRTVAECVRVELPLSGSGHRPATGRGFLFPIQYCPVVHHRVEAFVKRRTSSRIGSDGAQREILQAPRILLIKAALK